MDSHDKVHGIALSLFTSARDLSASPTADVVLIVFFCYL